MTADKVQRPRLLVSVQDADEAVIALSAGVDLLDVKAPHLGSLGRPTSAAVQSVLKARDRHAATVPVSAALGELKDYRAGEFEPEGLALVKLGLAGMASVPDWREQWVRARNESAESGGSNPQWVAVVYAEDLLANSPAPEAVIAEAVKSQCAGVLFDTWSKRSGGLLDHLSMARLQGLLSRVHAGGLFCAVAGKLRAEDLRQLDGAAIDVIAIRSAACVGSDRLGRLCPEKLAAFQAEMRRVWG